MNYFLDTVGSQGFYSFPKPGCMLTVGYPNELVEKLVEQVSTVAEAQGRRADRIHNFLNDGVCGVLVDEAGFVNLPLFAPARGHHVFDLFYNDKLCKAETALRCAGEHFKTALGIHDDWEKIYISNMSFSTLNQLTVSVIEKLIGERRMDKTGRRADRFLGAATAEGSVDYIGDITDGISKRYLIKGRPGTGKSTFMKKIAEQALSHGFDTEVYHCSFDPNSLDMIIMRELDVCLFDSTAPHEYFPSRTNDEIIDIYEIAVTSGTDERYADELAEIQTAYAAEIALAREQLKILKNYDDEVQEYYLASVDPQRFMEVEEKIIQNLLQ